MTTCDVEQDQRCPGCTGACRLTVANAAEFSTDPLAESLARCRHTFAWRRATLVVGDDASGLVFGAIPAGCNSPDARPVLEDAPVQRAYVR